MSDAASSLLEDAITLPDLDLCALEPVHTIGHIQPHGLLFALSEPDLVVRHVSANVANLLDRPVESVLGQSFEAILGSPHIEAFRAQVRGNQPLAVTSLRLNVGDGTIEMLCIPHRYDGMLVVELELNGGRHSLDAVDFDAHIRNPLWRVASATSILDLSQIAAQEIRTLSGFDRVMIYRFDEAWAGEVIAEAMADSPISYLGLRFPATDIPPQARRLFLVNPLRTIADVSAPAVPIVPDSGPLTHRPLDLTCSVLRSAAPVHLDYLRNMGVQSSMTVSIVVQNQLWGMVACHSAGPHRVDRATRAICEFIARIVASQLDLRIANVALEARLTSRNQLEAYMASVEASRSPVLAQRHRNGLLDLLDADGLISRIDGVVASQGTIVDETQIVPILERLRGLSSRGVASSSMLSDLDSSAEAYAVNVSGALYLGLSEGSGDYLLLSRRELVQTVVWAGDPDKPVSATEQGQLQPRASFAAWQQTVRGRSRPWTALQLESATVLREQLLRLREAQRLQRSQKQVRYLAHHDSLTGLFNRHSIHLKMEQWVKEAGGDQSTFAVLFIDLDHFKYFNDRLGHAAGDRILKVIAKRVQHQVRVEDVVGRLGGDEFIVILPGLADKADVLLAAGRISTAIGESLGIERGININITASIGISLYPADGTSKDALINRADTAMYRVKRGGGNAFEPYVLREEDDVARSA